MKVFMVRVLAVLSTFTLASAAAKAQDLQTSPLPSIRFIGSGCPLTKGGGPSYHWEASTLVVAFSDMVANKGPGISLIDSRKTCSITIKLKLPKGLSYSLSGYSAEGFDDLAAHDKRTLTVTNFFQGQDQTTTLSDVAVGPKAEDFSPNHLNLASEYLWSPCLAQRAQTITAAIRIGSGGDRTTSSAATLDILRLPIRVKHCNPL